MPENRFYSTEAFREGDEVTLTGDELHHLSVMRPRPGDSLELINGRNTLAFATLHTLDKHQALLKIKSVEKRLSPSHQLILAQAFLRPKNLDLVIEKGTEIGATAFWLFPGERSEKKELSKNQLTRLHTLTISAMKQCGRLDLPEIRLLSPLTKWEPLSFPLLYGDLSEGAMRPSPPSGDTAIAIGPEKGFSPSEEEALRTLGAQGISLSSNTLRAETAALCALTFLKY